MLDVLRHFVRILPEPGFLVSSAGEVLFANDAAGELSGVAARSLAGRPLSSFTTDPPEKVAHYLGLCARNRQLVPGSLAWRGRDGQVAEIRCDGAVVQANADAHPAVLFVRCRPKAESTDQFVLLNRKIADLSREVLERRKAELQRDELLVSERAARVEAERVSRVKDEFLATLGHELRTPLNAILGWAQLIRGGVASTEDLSQGVEVIERNARVQAKIVDDLLDMSRIISGKIRLDVQRVELAGVIRAAVDAVRPGAEAKGVRLQLAIDPIAGPVKGDPSRLQQVVWNLLSNAVKFTPRGGRVQVFLERVNSHLELVVSDTGEGIRPEFLPHVFDRFRQADGGTTRQHGGLGLGLSIVKQLVELHGGSVRATSPGEGQGATFAVILPLMVLHDPDEAAAGVHPSAAPADGPVGGVEAPSLAGVTVLVVDDEPDARDVVRRILQRCQARVLSAASTDEAMEALGAGAGAVDVLLSDIGMPGEDGYALIAKVRALPGQTGRLPAVALTAFARSEDRRRAILAGYQMHLSKPVEAGELVAVIASLAGRTGIGPARK